MGRRGSRGRGSFRGKSRGTRGTRGRGNHSNGTRSGYGNKRANETTGYAAESLKKPRFEENNKPVIQPLIESSSDSEEEVKPYAKLLSMFTSSRKTNAIVSSESEEESDDEASGEEGEAEEDCEEEDGEVASEEDGDEESQEEASVTLDELDSQDLAEEVEEEEEEVDSLDENGEFDEEDESEEELVTGRTDTFNLHFERGLSDELLENLSSPKPYKTSVLQWKNLGKLSVHLPAVETIDKKEEKKSILGETEDFASPGSWPELKFGIPLKDYGVKEQLCENLVKDSLSRDLTAEKLLTPLQHELFTLAHDYKDVYYPETNYTNCDEVRTAYCLHTLNHVLKSRDRILSHNMKLKSLKESGKDSQEEFRDQGLVRPRVLIVTPIKSSALRIIEIMASILLPAKGQVINKKKFYDEFGEEKDEDAEDGKPSSSKETNKIRRKPEDYEAVFSGNSDDSFRMGIAVAKRTLKLYAGFYVADILVASPLGLKTLIDENSDFLCSIEVLVLDQTDILYMQNWDHVLQLFQHLHLQPREQHGTDLSRVRLWALNDLSAHYRQNLIFSAVPLPEAAALFTRRGTNFAGKVRVENAVSLTSASVHRVIVQLPQTFHRFQSTLAKNVSEDRFQFFIKKILPQYLESMMTNTLIFVPSYYDYVRLREHFHKHDINFGQACEYTPDGKLAQVRERFFLAKKRMLLYTERLHFYRRLNIKGIQHIIFYQLPTYPHFYSELSNLLQESYQNKKYRGDSSQTCTILFSAYDAHRLSGVVGSERASQMLISDSSVHLLVSGED